jgi:hypothetical protein
MNWMEDDILQKNEEEVENVGSESEEDKNC